MCIVRALLWAVLISTNYEVFEYVVTNKARSQGKKSILTVPPLSWEEARVCGWGRGRGRKEAEGREAGWQGGGRRAEAEKR